LNIFCTINKSNCAAQISPVFRIGTHLRLTARISSYTFALIKLK
jgi:hypothetical protein